MARVRCARCGKKMPRQNWDAHAAQCVVDVRRWPASRRFPHFRREALDASLRAAFAAAYPDAWERIGARRRFMGEALGIDLHPDVLPFSNLAAFLPPFLLRPDRAMTLAG